MNALYTQQQLRQMALTVSTVARLYGLSSFDVALPIEWVKQCLNHGFNPVGTVVWCYDLSVFGEPFPLSQETEQELRQIFPGCEFKVLDYFFNKTP